MSSNCAYSFRDLFRAAFGREAEQSELESLYSLPQAEKNQKVKDWAGKAGWVSEDIKGYDGQIYTGFGPKSDDLCK